MSKRHLALLSIASIGWSRAVVVSIVVIITAISVYLARTKARSDEPARKLDLISTLALSIFALGTVLHRYGDAWAGRFVRRPPPTLGP